MAASHLPYLQLFWASKLGKVWNDLRWLTQFHALIFERRKLYCRNWWELALYDIYLQYFPENICRFFHRMFRASSGSVTTFLRRSMIHSSWPLWRDRRTCASHHLRLKAPPIVWTLHIQKSHLKEFINLERNGKAAYLFVGKLHMRYPQPQEGHWNSPHFFKLHNGKQGYNKSGPEFLVTWSWHTFKYVNVVWITVTLDASNKRCLSPWAARCHCIFLRKFFPFNL